MGASPEVRAHARSVHVQALRQAGAGSASHHTPEPGEHLGREGNSEP